MCAAKLTVTLHLCGGTQIKNKPKINEDPKDALLREFQDQIAKLKNQLDGKGGPKKKKKKKKGRKRIVINENGEEVEEYSDGEEEDEDDSAAQEVRRHRLVKAAVHFVHRVGVYVWFT